MRRRVSILVVAATGSVVVLAAVGRSGPPPVNPISFGVSQALPRAGTSFTGVMMSVRPDYLGRIQVRKLSCHAELEAHPVVAKVKKFYIGHSYGAHLVGATCSIRIPTWAKPGMVLTLSGKPGSHGPGGFSVIYTASDPSAGFGGGTSIYEGPGWWTVGPLPRPAR
jgi:hypothetical protein